jgi:hypothetical protein
MKVYISIDYMEYNQEQLAEAEQNIVKDIENNFGESCSIVPHTYPILLDSNASLGDKAKRIIRVVSEMQNADYVVVPEDYYHYFTCRDDIALSEIFAIPLIKSKNIFMKK